jgi:hypothetical protein
MGPVGGNAGERCIGLRDLFWKEDAVVVWCSRELEDAKNGSCRKKLDIEGVKGFSIVQALGGGGGEREREGGGGGGGGYGGVWYQRF